MTPQAIAHNLINQAEAYLAAAGAVVVPPLAAEPLSEETVTTDAHRILSEAAGQLRAVGLAPEIASELMLGYSAAWASKIGTGASAAERLYRHADALIGKGAVKH